MILTIDVHEAAARLDELLATVASGGEVVIARGSRGVAKLTKITDDDDATRAIAEIRAARRGLPKTTIEEILQWKDEDRR